jgi:uncharacterized SAM-binding protein YcdF (DUF218 family)
LIGGFPWQKIFWVTLRGRAGLPGRPCGAPSGRALPEYAFCFMSFLYALFLKLLYPTSLCALFCLSAALFRKREKLNRYLTWTAFAILMICGNGWLIGALTQNLEWRYLPPDPVPTADAIVVLSGGIVDRIPPRPTIEVGEAGDRLLYAAHLFKQQRAEKIICTGGVATGGIAPRSAAEVMQEFLETMGVAKDAIIIEGGSSDTHQHSANLNAILEKQKIRKVLLVTSAMHMPRSVGVFRKQCPGVEFVPAPTDFHTTKEWTVIPWYRKLVAIVPTPSHLSAFSEVMHEYLGIAYYCLRGWM